MDPERVFVGSSDNNVYNLSANGGLFWSYTTGNVRSFPRICVSIGEGHPLPR